MIVGTARDPGQGRTMRGISQVVLLMLLATMMLMCIGNVDAGVLRGVVTNTDNGLHVPGAVVSVNASGNASLMTVNADANGSYSIDLETGNYTVSVSAVEYGTNSSTVALGNGTMWHNVSLDRATPGFDLAITAACGTDPPVEGEEVNLIITITNLMDRNVTLFVELEVDGWPMESANMNIAPNGTDYMLHDCFPDAGEHHITVKASEGDDWMWFVMDVTVGEAPGDADEDDGDGNELVVVGIALAVLLIGAIFVVRRG